MTMFTTTYEGKLMNPDLPYALRFKVGCSLFFPRICLRAHCAASSAEVALLRRTSQRAGANHDHVFNLKELKGEGGKSFLFKKVVVVK